MSLLVSGDLISLDKCCSECNVPALDDREGFPNKLRIPSVIDIGHDWQDTLNPDDILQIGPLALALDRLVAIGLILAFLTALDWIIRHYRVTAWQPAVLAVFAGLLTARAGHVWLYRESYALEPVAALQVWLGGWDWRFGVGGAGIALILNLRRLGPAAAGIAALGVLSLIWIGFLSLGVGKPALRLPQGLVLEEAPSETGSASVWRIGQLRGRPLVINLWTTWCPPCRREMPMLTQAAKAERRATILLVNQSERPAQISAFLRAQGLDPEYIALDPNGMLGEMIGARALPTTLFIDRDGTVRQVHTGEITKVQLDIAIRALE